MALKQKSDILYNIRGENQLLLNLDVQFDDLRDCSESFQRAFMDAWKVHNILYYSVRTRILWLTVQYLYLQAIKNGSMRKLKDSIEAMKTNADSCPGIKKYLDVCYLQSVVSPRKKATTLFYMTLLAHAAVQKQKMMVKILLDSGASKIY